MTLMKLGAGLLLFGALSACQEEHAAMQSERYRFELLAAPFDVVRPDGQHAQGERVVRYDRLSGETWLNDNANGLRKIEEPEAIERGHYLVSLTVTANGHVLVNRLERSSGEAWYMDSENIWRRYTQPAQPQVQPQAQPRGG